MMTLAPGISTELAMNAVNYIISLAEKNNLEIAVAVSDRHGELISFCRTEDCCLASIKVAIAKSYSAARLKESTRDFLNNGYSIENLAHGGYTSYPGGFPIYSEGSVIGGIGVSGLTPEEDESLAMKAVELYWKHE